MPQGIGTELGSLANGVNSFMFSGLGASAINVMASSVGVLADSVKNGKMLPFLTIWEQN